MSHHGSDPFGPKRKETFEMLKNTTAFRGALGDGTYIEKFKERASRLMKEVA